MRRLAALGALLVLLAACVPVSDPLVGSKAMCVYEAVNRPQRLSYVMDGGGSCMYLNTEERTDAAMSLARYALSLGSEE